jgi:alkanesulfonate monooxygenase SsuD/methylene tetrahydromethanopterin reductase-like flavin-dependent oxidoreductase (luciferase family)
MTPDMSFAVFYDFRNPARWRQPWADRYAQILDQIEWIDRSSPFDGVSLSEHHFVDDGYAPSMLALAAAVAMRTERVDIFTNVLLLPLHDPLRVAEDSITVDILSRGRFRLGVGVGYREQEFAGFGTSLRDRRDRMEEGLEIIKKAFANEPFSFQGKHWSFPEIKVSPAPHTPGGPPIWIGGTVPAALERAAKHAVGFLASTDDEVRGYVQACRDLGKEPGPAGRNAWLIVEEDPERTLAEVGDNMLYQVNQYIDYGFLKVRPYDDPQVLLDQGYYQLVDADGAIELIKESRAAGVTEFGFFGALPGEPIERGQRRLDYLSRSVIPAFKGTGA